ncbi:MAG: integrase, partial [Nakamurella sp.]
QRNQDRAARYTTRAHLRIYLEEFHPNTSSLPVIRPVFYHQRAGKPAGLSFDAVLNLVKQAADLARGACPAMPTSMHCHLLRETKAMDLYQQGIQLPIIVRLFGHEQEATSSEFYAFATMDMMRAAINAATPAPNHRPKRSPSRHFKPCAACDNTRNVKPRNRNHLASPPVETPIPRLNENLGII